MRAVFDENFKPIFIGLQYMANEDNYEFEFDSSKNPSTAMLLGIAESLRIRGSFAMDTSRLITAIDTKLISLTETKKMKTDKKVNLNKVIKKMYEKSSTEDQMIIAVVESGIGYKDAIATYERICIELGFKVKPMATKDRNIAVVKMLKKTKLKKIKDWNGIIELINKIIKKLEGVSEGNAISSIRAIFRDQEIKFPKRPKVKKERISIATRITEWILENLDSTPEGLAEWAHDNKIGPARVVMFSDVMLSIQAHSEDEDEDDDDDDEDDAIKEKGKGKGKGKGKVDDDDDEDEDEDDDDEDDEDEDEDDDDEDDDDDD